MPRDGSLHRLRIVFFGTPSFSVPALNSLVDANFEIAFVVTQPDRPKGRKRVLTPPPIKLKALGYGIPVLQPKDPNKDEFISRLKASPPDLIVTVAYGHLLSKRLLSLPSLGCINLHASLLPKYRGATPIAWAILQGEEKSGVTVMLMDEGMDTGPILRKADVPILPEDTTASLSLRLSEIGANLLPETIAAFASDKISPIPQDESKATYAPPLKKKDGRIDWGKSAGEIERHIRAMIPWPSAFTMLKDKTLKIYKAKVTGQSLSLPPGHGIITDDAFHIATGDGTLKLVEVQLEGRKRMDIADFLKGFKKRGETVFAWPR